METEKNVGTFMTGYRRGYVCVDRRFKERKVSLEFALDEHKNSNKYRAAKYLREQGATTITVSSNQHRLSSQYCYDIYKGYCAA